MLARLENLDDILASLFGFGFFPAREYVGRCVTVLGPGVNRYVGLGNSQDAGNALGVELMERLANDVDAYLIRYMYEGFLNEVEIVQQVLVATFELQQYLGA